MSLGPFSAAGVMTRLQTVTQLKIVGTATDLSSALNQQPTATPAAYVVVQEQGRPPKGFTGVMAQEVEVAIQVVIFVASYAGKGAAAQVELDDVLRPAIRAALLAWAPSSSFTKLSLQASRNEKFTAPFLVAQEIYRSGYRIQVSA